jgi:hypothetical protein
MTRKIKPKWRQITNDQFRAAELICLPKRGLGESIYWRLFFFFQRALQNRGKEAGVHIFYVVIY